MIISKYREWICGERECGERECGERECGERECSVVRGYVVSRRVESVC